MRSATESGPTPSLVWTSTVEDSRRRTPRQRGDSPSLRQRPHRPVSARQLSARRPKEGREEGDRERKWEKEQRERDNFKGF